MTKNYFNLKFFFISDLHFGIRNASQEWLKNQLLYFDNFLIPNVRKHNGDKILIIAGDVFDNRQNINISIFYYVFNLFKKLSKEFKEIHIILGNHDISNKKTNDINMLQVFNLIENISVYSEPKIVQFDKIKILFMPWADHKEHILLQEIKEKCDYLVLHTDINTLRFNKYAKINNGINIVQLNNFTQVFSGHIHFRQEKDNIIMLGSPYHINRNDLNNKKCIYTLNPKTNEIDRIFNNYSSEFKQINFYSLIEMKLNEALDFFNNSYIYLEIANIISFENGINRILNVLNNSKNLKIFYYEENDIENVNITYDNNFSIDDIINEYVNSLKEEEKDKLKVKYIIKKYKKEIEL